MNRLELIRAEVDEILLSQPNVKERRDGYVHLYGVAQNCTLLALKRGLDVELCAIIGMLHDIFTYKYQYVKNHAVLGMDEAEQILVKLDVFSKKEIKLLITAIGNHSDKKNKHDKYSEMIKDADVLHNSFYSNTLEIKHHKRLKKILSKFELELKIKAVKNSNDSNIKLDKVAKRPNK
jgi:uncharacterized protein